MNAFIAYTIIGLVYGAGYAIAASGFVLTYTTSRIFNMAHGAMALAGAVVYYDLVIHHGWPRLVALLFVVGVLAPLFGIVVDRLLMRGLADVPVNISLTVTVGLFLLVYGTVTAKFSVDKIGPPTALLKSVHVRIFGQGISGNDLLMVIVAAAVAAGFYLFFKFTRTGIAMRAVVDNRGLVALHGGRPGFLSATAWAIGSALAALAGILLIPDIGLYPYILLTLLVITAYAAAVLGKLENLPLTFLGSLILGLGYSYAIGYMPTTTFYTGLRTGIPAIFLFLVLVLLPRAPLRVGQIKGIVSVPVPGRTKTIVASVITVAVVAVIAPMLSDSKAGDMSLAFVYASIMLSLVLLTGYGGYLNLAPLAFAGLGALIVGKLSTTSPYQFVVAAAVTGAIGAALGLLAIRLGTLYLAIATLAFAELVDYVIFNANFGFKGGGEIVIHRVSLFGLGVSSEQRFAVFASVVFVLLGMLVLAIRRGRYGRLLIALRDSPAACGTLGLNLTLTRVTVFAVSSAMAGFAGAVFANQAVSFGEVNFTFILNLFVVLGAVVGGVTSVSGALLGGFILTALFRGPEWLKTYSGVLIGISAMLLGRNPNGLVSYAFKLGRWAQAAVTRSSGETSHGSAAEDRSEVRGREEVVLGGSA